MKKCFFFALTAAIMSFAGCQEKELNAPVNSNEGSSTFELVADIAQTKTTLDAETYEVEWETGDIVYLVTSDGTWGAPYVDKDNTNIETIAEFEYADGRFTSDAEIAAGSYTFKAMFAHESQKTYHRGASSTHKLQATQSQDCTYPTAHIKGNDALVGTFTATVPTADKQAVTMFHLYTLMQVDIKNDTGAEVTVTQFEMTAVEADLAGVFNVDFENRTITTKQDPSSTITVKVAGGTVAAGNALPVYFVMAPLSKYTGDVTFKVTDANGKTYTKTITIKEEGLDFKAGTYNTTSYTISEADAVAPNVTWDLTAASYESESAETVVWSSEFVNLTLEKGESATDANNFLGGKEEHTRVYKDQVMSFDPLGKYQIESIEFSVLESSYVDELTNSKWTNGGVSYNGKIVTVIPTDGHRNVSVTIGAATRFTGITVYYSYDDDYVLPTVKSLTVSGQTLQFVQYADFDFDGTVLATYTDDTVLDVTDKVTTSSPDMTTIGTKEVLVSYTDVDKTYTVSYEIEVIEASALSGWIETSFADLKDGDQVVIVGVKSSKQYAMSNDKGTSSAPTPVEVTVSGNKLAVDPEDNIIWYVGEDSANRIFYATSTKDTWLYCTNTNNGVRVGTNTAKTFAWSNDYLQHVGTSRYLGIYNTQDWRCYTSHTATNIANQTFQFYVKVGGSDGGTEEPDPTPTPVELIMSEVTCSGQTENSLTFIWTGVEGATAYQVYFDSEDKGQITELTYTASELEAGTSHTIAVKAVGDNVNYTTSSTAKTCTASTTSTSQGGGETTQNVVTFDYTGASSNSSYSGETIDGVTLSGSSISTNKAGEFRVFANEGTFTLDAGSQTITKIEFTFSGNSYKGTFDLDGYTDGVWSGNASKVTFNNTGSQARIKKIVVTLN